jgi:hypothetical protein
LYSYEFKEDDEKMKYFQPTLKGCPFKDPVMTDSFKGGTIIQNK